MEIHVPKPFTAERPAVSYTHQSLAIDIKDHPLARTLPEATQTSSIQPGPQTFRVFAAREDAPSVFEDFVSQDTPQLSLHITSFNDATLVGLSYPHTLMDVMGQHALMLGWSLVLAGRESEVPRMVGAREDLIGAAANAPVEQEEEYKLGLKQLQGLSMFKFGLRFAWDMLWNRVIETRTIFLTQEKVARLRRQAQADLAALEDAPEDKPFISEGDVLTAWAIRATASSLPQPRPVTALHALNARFRLSAIVQAPGVHLQNMAVAAFTFLSPEVARGPLGPIALENRRHLMEQSTEAQVLAGLRREYKLNSDSPFMCGEPDALLVPFTNWSRASFFKTIDFSPAVMRTGETGESRSNAPGTIVFHHAQSMRPTSTTRNVFVILGKDHGDNYWLFGTLPPQVWAKIEEDINV